MRALWRTSSICWATRLKGRKAGSNELGAWAISNTAIALWTCHKSAAAQELCLSCGSAGLLDGVSPAALLDASPALNCSLGLREHPSPYPVHFCAPFESHGLWLSRALWSMYIQELKLPITSSLGGRCTRSHQKPPVRSRAPGGPQMAFAVEHQIVCFRAVSELF